MTTTTIARTITGGVDTHLDVHVAAALDERGALLGIESSPPRPRAIGRCCVGWSKLNPTVAETRELG